MKETILGSRATDLRDKVFGTLTAVRIVGTDPRGRAKWKCRCVCGQFVTRAANSLKMASSCSRSCPGPKAPKQVPDVSVAPTPTLDVDRNRERYVRLKVSERAHGNELRPFPDYTCSECPMAPECVQAFATRNVNGECTEAK